MTPHARLRYGTFAILIVGFAAAIIVFFTAQPPEANPLGYDPLDTKKYLHDLEVYGGKANLLAEEFREWFDSLWHGRQLALTIVVITLLVVLVFRFFAKPLPPHLVASDRPRGNADGRG